MRRYSLSLVHGPLHLLNVRCYSLLKLADLHTPSLHLPENVRGHCNFECDPLCTGHSLGGAMATTAALLYRTDTDFLSTQERTILYTHGAPRVGNSKLAKTLNEYIPYNYRVVFNRDPVPHLPPVGNVYHAGLEVRMCFLYGLATLP